MDNVEFWSVIARARGTTSPEAGSAEASNLKQVLESFATAEVKAFSRRYNELLCELNTWELWGAGYVLQGGMGDDEFHYFLSWVIGKGEAVFRVAKDEPDSLANYVGDEDVDNEALEYAALDVLEDRSVADPRDEFDGFPDDDPTGEEWDEDEVGDLYPGCLQVSRRRGNLE